MTVVKLPEKRSLGAGDGLARLTPREHQVLALMAEGLSNAMICSRLWVTEKTLESHIRSVYRKLELPPADRCHRRVMAVLAFLSATGARRAA